MRLVLAQTLHRSQCASAGTQAVSLRRPRVRRMAIEPGRGS